MRPSATDVVDQAVEELSQLVGATSASFSAVADAFEAYAAKAPSAMHEGIAAVIAQECRDAAESAQVRRAFLQAFRS